MAGGAAPLAALAAALDEAVVGHGDAKLALRVALLAGEHALLTGPPGCGKTALAEAFARASGLAAATLHFHRDASAASWLGEAWLVRRREGGGERLARGRGAGPLAEARVAVLDDVTRAPGAARAPLWRALAERRDAGRALPLWTAVATAPAAPDDAVADPLTPAALDRFALQVRMRGLVATGELALLRALLAREAARRAPAASPCPAPTSASRAAAEAEIATLRARAAALPLPAEWQHAWLALAARVGGLAEAGAPSDRSFARAGPALLRAHALLHGRAAVARADLAVMRLMLAQRVPEEARARAEAWIAEAAGEATLCAPHAGSVPGAPGAGGATPAADVATRASAPLREDGTPAAAGSRGVAAPAADVARLVRALEGTLDRAPARAGEDPGGAPRRRRPLRHLDELLDADAVEAALFAEGALPEGPRTLARERRSRAGALVVLRDVSASMEGARARFAGRVVAGLVRAGARRRMRLGYVEFHHHAEPLLAAGRLFHRRYGALLARAGGARAEGRTSYEAPLRVALDALAGRARGGAHAVLVTDGVPVVGDPRVRRERGRARALGVRVHTVYVGDDSFPEILETLARETGGSAFHAAPGAGGALRVRRREEPA